MITHYFKDFLANSDEYRRVENYWISRWNDIMKNRLDSDWSYPWISTGAPDLLDGNPIFSAVSPSKRRGVRIIQHEPTSDKVEILAWTDLVGGKFHDPDAIQELVISCALSDAAADFAAAMIGPWVEGKSISFNRVDGGRIIPDNDHDDCRVSRIRSPFAA